MDLSPGDAAHSEVSTIAAIRSGTAAAKAGMKEHASRDHPDPAA